MSPDHHSNCEDEIHIEYAWNLADIGGRLMPVSNSSDARQL
jgi:hypothetical protein